VTAPGPTRSGASPFSLEPGAVPVFYNPGSGTAVDPDELRRSGAAHGLALQPIDIKDRDAAADALRANPPPLWIAAGGDGTVASVATLALEAGGELGVLPLGTRNHFARDVGLPLELDGAMQVIAAGVSRPVDVGEVDGRVFLNNASLGLYTRFVLVREHEEQRPGLKLWPALAKAAWHALRTSRNLGVRLRADDDALARRTPVLLVGNNRYTVEGLQRGRRECLDAGCLSVYVLRPRSRAALVWFGLRALVGAVSAPRDFDALDTDTLVVSAQASEVEVALDGEVMRMPTPLHFRCRPRALRVRAPRPDAG
jgi:diacylglycerol kinase family enzyme